MARSPGTVSATILNVDDNETARRAVSLYLEGAGFAVREAGTGQEALRLAAQRPDLVLLDVVLPDVDGFEVCRRIKSDPATALTPVLMISAHSVRSNDRVHGLEGGADGYLTKPLDPAEVVAQVRALLRIRRAEEKERTARAEAEESRARLAAIVESSDDAIVGTSLEGAVTTWNAGAERLYGYPAAEALGRRLAVLVPAERRGQFEQMLDGIRAGGHVAPFETVHVRKDGRRIEVSLRLSPVTGAAGNVTGAAAIARDITGQKRLEEQYRQAQKMEAVGQLAGGVAHDFNNLLTIINGYAEILLTTLSAGEPARELIGEVRKAGERAAALTRQLLAFSRKQVLAPVVLNLNTAVIDTEKMLRRVIGEDVDLATNLQPSLGNVRADPGQVEQVLLNLAVNARDAMPQGGKLTIETRNTDLGRSYLEVPPGPYVLLAVSDTGVGMTEEVKAHIFEPFFTTKGVGKGTGLGLATVYGIVKQSGGHVAVYSEPGVGTTFKIYFPRVSEAVKTGRSFHGAEPVPGGSETVLVVEDEEAVRNLTRHVLHECGYRVLAAGNGREALAVAREHGGAIDLLVTDVIMPELGGRRLAEQLGPLHPDMKVLFLSGYTDDAVFRHGVLLEQTNFLQKPFSPAVLARKVREVLDTPLRSGPLPAG